MTIEEITKKFADAGAVLPGKRVKFDFGAAGKIMLDGVSNAVTNEDGDANTTLTISLDDALALFNGKLDPTMAFMQGKLKVLGDMGTAMQLQGALSKLRS